MADWNIGSDKAGQSKGTLKNETDRKTYKGLAAVRKGFEEMLAHDAGGESRDGSIFICGEKGVMEWSYIHKQPDGSSVELRGCDIFEFRDGKIHRKNAFRKSRIM